MGRLLTFAFIAACALLPAVRGRKCLVETLFHGESTSTGNAMKGKKIDCTADYCLASETTNSKGFIKGHECGGLDAKFKLAAQKMGFDAVQVDKKCAGLPDGGEHKVYGKTTEGTRETGYCCKKETCDAYGTMAAPAVAPLAFFAAVPLLTLFRPF